VGGLCILSDLALPDWVAARPSIWFAGEVGSELKERQEKELKMRHYYYHCDRNPDGFARLKAENFAKDYPED
jgi:hypothetical protein